MTPLPSLPANLNTSNIGTTLAGVASQVTPQFPSLPSIPNVPNISGLQGLVSSNLVGPTAQLQQFSAASATTLAIIEAAIPEEQITQLIEQYRLPNGTVDLNSVKNELNQINNNLTTTYSKVIDSSQLPAVSVSGVLTQLIPDIPIPNIPSPAEIKQYINNLIDRKKQLEQQVIMKGQQLEAEREQLPFTARNEEVNTI